MVLASFCGSPIACCVEELYAATSKSRKPGVLAEDTNSEDISTVVPSIKALLMSVRRGSVMRHSPNV